MHAMSHLHVQLTTFFHFCTRATILTLLLMIDRHEYLHKELMFAGSIQMGRDDACSISSQPVEKPSTVYELESSTCRETGIPGQVGF